MAVSWFWLSPRICCSFESATFSRVDWQDAGSSTPQHSSLKADNAITDVLTAFSVLQASQPPFASAPYLRQLRLHHVWPVAVRVPLSGPVVAGGSGRVSIRCSVLGFDLWLTYSSRVLVCCCCHSYLRQFLLHG